MARFKTSLILILSLTIIFTACGSDVNNNVETFTVSTDEFIISVTETGELEAVNSKMIYTPDVSWQILSMLKITRIIEDGKQVETGEVLMEFDKTDVNKAIADATASLEISQAELRKADANHKSQLEELETNLEVAKLNQNISKLNLQMKQYTAEVERKNIELELEKANINLDRAQQEIDNKKGINREEINTLKLKVQQAQYKLDEAKRTLDMLTVKAPAPGIAIINKNWTTRQKWAINDQAWPGYPIIGLPDLSSMRANLEINEVDISKIKLGQRSIVRLDAFPDVEFHGKINDVATLARLKNRDSKVKIFDVVVLLDGSDEKLMPGMTVNCEIIIDKIPDVVYIPLDALFINEGQNFVYIKNGNGFEVRNVTVGEENDNFVIISEGLEDGDQIALRDPFELIN